MSELFKETNFNGNISNWDVSNVKNMSDMFFVCESFNQDISHWNVSKVKTHRGIFGGCPMNIYEKYKPKFK